MKVLVLNHQGIGDIIMRIAIYRAIRESDINAHIVSTVKSVTEADLLISQGLSDELMLINTGEMTLLGKILWMRRIIFKRFDYLVVPYGFNVWYSIFFKLLSLSRYLVSGYDNVIQSYFITHQVNFHRSAKRVYNNHLIAKIFCNDTDMVPSLRVLDSGVFEKFGLKSGADYIVIHPGSGMLEKHKRWDAHNYSSLINNILLNNDYTFILVGAAGEVNLGSEIIYNVSDKAGVINLVGKTNINETICLLSKSKCLISSDSGIMHLASAIKTQTFTLFGPTSQRSIFPFWNNGKVISNLPVCAPCYPERIQGCKNPVCMDQINVDMVLNCLRRDGIID